MSYLSQQAIDLIISDMQLGADTQLDACRKDAAIVFLKDYYPEGVAGRRLSSEEKAQQWVKGRVKALKEQATDLTV